jgi:hypothetical protein
MPDLLALLDAAIDELDSSRCSRLHCNTERRTGTDNQLRNGAVPVVPAIPGQKRELCDSLISSADTEYQQWQDGGARECLSKSMGITGTTGANEAFRGSPVPAEAKESGNDREHAKLETGATEGHAPTLVADLAAIWGEAEEGRAAIVEHDGGIPRAWSEGFARLHPDRPPGDVPAKRWLAFIDDIGWFLDSPFCSVAAALGWGPQDLFGCDRDRPFAGVDQAAGLLWLLNGDRLVALTENTATIETKTGVRQIWRRKPKEPGRVLAWDLSDDH